MILLVSSPNCMLQTGRVSNHKLRTMILKNKLEDCVLTHQPGWIYLANVCSFITALFQMQGIHARSIKKAKAKDVFTMQNT